MKRFGLFLAIVFLVLMLWGLIFRPAQGQGTCQPGMPCYQGAQQYVSPPPGYQGGPCSPQGNSQLFAGTQPAVVNGELRSPNWTDKFVVVTSFPDAGGRWEGTGVHIATDGTRSWVLTCAHQSKREGVVYTADGGKFQAIKLAEDREADVAVYRTSALRVPAIAIASGDAQINQEVALGGFAPGYYRAKTGAKVTSYANTEDAWINTAVQVGDSGGPVVSNNLLVGIITATDNTQTLYTRVGPIRRLLSRIRGIPFQSTNVNVQVQSQGNAPQPSPTQSNNCVEKFKSILARLDEQEENLAKSSVIFDARLTTLEQTVGNFPKKPIPGPPGPQGEPGKDGKDADNSDLILRINQLEVQLAELRATTPVTWDIVPKE